METTTFTVRAKTSEQVKKAVAKLTLPKNENGQYTHDAILIFKNLSALVNTETDYDTTTAYAITSDSKLSVEKSHRQAHHKNKRKEKYMRCQSASRYQGK